MTDSGGPAPTVIVARHVDPARSGEAEEWLRRLADAAGSMPGFVDATMQPPSDQHADEWVIVYRFSSADMLRSWMDSPQRADLLAEGDELLLGSAREQIVTLADERRSVTAVASFCMRAGSETDLIAWYRELQTTLIGFAGFVRAELVEPTPGTQTDTAIVFSFTERRCLDRWLESPERADLLARLEPFVEGERTVNVVGGFAGWFPGSADAGTTKRWKQAALVLLALYPTSLAISALRDALAPDLNAPLAILLGNVVGVAVLSWALMPFLTSRFDRWLQR